MPRHTLPTKDSRMSLHHSARAGHQSRDVHTAVKIIALLGRAGLSQAAIAKRHGVRADAINRTIWGVRNGKRLRAAIAHELGYRDWEALKQARVTV